MSTTKTFELEIGIEELEPKIAPDGGETVLPLGGTKNLNGNNGNGKG